MLSTKIRTGIAAVLAASSVAATSVVPAVSQAKPINPYRSVTTANAMKKQAVSGLCQETREVVNEGLRNLEKAHKEGNAEAIKTNQNIVNNNYQFGYELGCGFTQ